MTAEEFVRSIKRVIYDTAISDIEELFTAPPGRNPAKTLRTVSQWFEQLSERERENVHSVICHSVHHTLFGILSVMDGVRSIADEPGERGRLELRYEIGGESHLINSASEKFLHDIFNELVMDQQGNLAE